jgi:DNA-binding YbaB/EbfC family protein
MNMGKGFSGIPGNMQAILKQAQKLQEQMKKAQQEAETYTEDAASGGGMVKVVAGGKNRLMSIEIDKQVVNPDDIEMLQDLILAACNEALQKVQQRVKAEMEKVTGGAPIPGMM